MKIFGALIRYLIFIFSLTSLFVSCNIGDTGGACYYESYFYRIYPAISDTYTRSCFRADSYQECNDYEKNRCLNDNIDCKEIFVLSYDQGEECLTNPENNFMIYKH